MKVIATKPFKVGDWLIEPELLRISRKEEIRQLEFKSMEILLCFVSNQGEVVTRKKLHEEVWGEVFVTDNALTRAVSRLRKALGDDPLQPKYIDTISKSGYRLVAPINFISAQNEVAITNKDVSIKQRVDKTWLWGMSLFVFVLIGLSLRSILSKNVYTKFYDPTPVSTLLGPELGLSISPDGEKISFSYSKPGANNADVYIKLLADLSQVKFTDLESHQGFGIWSPDGNYMTYVSAEDGNCGIYKEPFFGGEKTRIGDCFQSPQDLVWSPDGKTIAFTDIDSTTQLRRIFFLDIATQIVKEMLNPENGSSDRDPAFTPDGKFLVFRRTINGQGRDIYKLRLANKKLIRLTFDNARILGLDVFDNGQQIAFSSNRGGPWGLWRIPFNGGTISRFHINERSPTELRFSANGKRMVYRSIQDQTNLWVIDKEISDNKTPSPIAQSSRAEMSPVLSNDGSKVVFLSNRSGHFEIWSDNLGENNPTKLTTLKANFINMPSWSADNSEIVFDARMDGGNAIYILDVASKMIRSFVNLDGDQVNARYSRDGKYIYFGSNHTGNWQIWKKSVLGDDSTIQQVTKNGGYYLQEGPDDYLYYTQFDTVGLWKMEKEGAAPAEQFLPNLTDIDWGNWVPVKEGVIYIDRSSGVQLYHQPYNKKEKPTALFTPSKPIQLWNSSLTADADGSKVLFVQIENSEDEIMMVDFK